MDENTEKERAISELLDLTLGLRKAMMISNRHHTAQNKLHSDMNEIQVQDVKYSAHEFLKSICHDDMNVLDITENPITESTHFPILSSGKLNEFNEWLEKEKQSLEERERMQVMQQTINHLKMQLNARQRHQEKTELSQHTISNGTSHSSTTEHLVQRLERVEQEKKQQLRGQIKDKLMVRVNKQMEEVEHMNKQKEHELAELETLKAKQEMQALQFENDRMKSELRAERLERILVKTEMEKDPEKIVTQFGRLQKTNETLKDQIESLQEEQNQMPQKEKDELLRQITVLQKEKAVMASELKKKSKTIQELRQNAKQHQANVETLRQRLRKEVQSLVQEDGKKKSKTKKPKGVKRLDNLDCVQETIGKSRTKWMQRENELRKAHQDYLQIIQNCEHKAKAEMNRVIELKSRGGKLEKQVMRQQRQMENREKKKMTRDYRDELPIGTRDGMTQTDLLHQEKVLLVDEIHIVTDSSSFDSNEIYV